MEKNKEYLLWFEQLRREDVDIVGGKSASLGEMTSTPMFLYLTALLLPHTLIVILLKKAACKVNWNPFCQS